MASSTPKEHIQHLQLVLERFKHYGMIIRPSKCVLGATTLQFLGHQVDIEGIRPLEEKVTAIQVFGPGQLLSLFCQELCSNCTTS